MKTASRHEMFAYDADEALAGFVAPYVNEGLAQGEAVVAAYVAGKQSLVRDALGPIHEAVTFADADEVYTRPEATVRRYDGTIRQLLRDGASSVRVVGELPIAETQRAWDAWLLYEALLNRVFAHFPLRVVCTLDRREVPEAAVHAYQRAHPRIHDSGSGNGDGHESPDYVDPVEMVRALTPEPARLPELRDVPAGDNPRLFRRQLAREMAAAAVPGDKASEMLLAASEVYNNAVLHGNGAPTLRVGRVDGDFVCELSDHGAGLDDPLAGYVPPREGAAAGAGLWIARQLASRMELLATPGGGLTTRLWA